MNAIRKGTELFLQLLKYPLFVLLALYGGHEIDHLACAFPILPRVLVFLIECIVLCLAGYTLLWVSSFWERLPLLISLPLGGASLLGIACESVAMCGKSLKWHIWLFPWLRLVATTIFTGAQNQQRSHFLPDERILMFLAALGCLTFRHIDSAHYVRASLPWGAFLVYLVAAIQYHLAAEQRRKAHMEQPQRILQQAVNHEEDKIGYSRIREGILKCIHKHISSPVEGNTAAASHAHALGLFGQWGSGKTHLLNLVEKALVESDTKGPHGCFCCVNLWQISDKDELWQTTHTTLEHAYGIRHSFFYHLYKRFKALGHVPAVDSWSAVAHTIFRWQEHSSKELISILRQELKETPCLPIVLLFDNVERAELSIIQELLPLVERLKYLPQLFIILSIAEDELARKFEAKGRHADTMHGHLFKLIDTPVYLPEPTENQAQEIFRSVCCEKAKEMSFLQRYAKETPPTFDTPRQIERAVTTLAALEAKRFAESQTFITEEGKEKTYPFVHVAYTTELIHLFYPRAFEAFRQLPEIWLTYNPEKTPETDEGKGEACLPDMLHLAATLLKDVKEEFPGAGKSFFTNLNIIREYLEHRLFRSLLNLLSGRSVLHFRQALELRHLDCSTFSASQCDAVVYAYQWPDSYQTPRLLIEREYPVDFRPSTDICIASIVKHCISTIRGFTIRLANNAKNVEEISPYIQTLLNLLIQEKNSSVMNWQNHLTADELLWTLIWYTCRLPEHEEEGQLAWEALYQWLCKCSFNTLSLSMIRILYSRECTKGGPHISTPLVGKKHAFQPVAHDKYSSYRAWEQALGYHYARKLMEMLNHPTAALPRSYRDKDYTVYHANERTQDMRFNGPMNACIKEWVAEHPNPSVNFLPNFLQLLAVSHTADNGHQAPDISNSCAELYRPIFLFCAEHIHALCPKNSFPAISKQVVDLLAKWKNSPFMSNDAVAFSIFKETIGEALQQLRSEYEK